MVRREVVGIVCLSLVAGLLVVGLLLRVESDYYVKMISSTVPDRLVRSVGSRPVFSIGLVSGRDFEELSLGFSVMSEADPQSWVREGEWVVEGDLASGMTGLLPVDTWLDRAASLGTQISPLGGSVTVNGTLYGAVIFDFRNLAGSSTYMSVFAALFKNGNLTKTYWGYPDFFVHREATVVSFKVELGQGVEVYSMHPKGEERPVAGLPENGQLVMRDVSKDDQILLTMVLEGHAVPTEISWLWICMPTADGRSEDPWIFSTL